MTDTELTSDGAGELLSQAYAQCYLNFGDSLLSNTSTTRFDPLIGAWSSITGLADSKDEIYVTSSGNRLGNLQVRLKQGTRAGRHTPLGVGVCDAEMLEEDNDIQSLFSSLKENVAKGETSYDVIVALASDKDKCEVKGIFRFSRSGLGDLLERYFPNAKVFTEICGRSPTVTVNKEYSPDADLLERALSILEEHKNIVLEGPPGSGKTEFARALGIQLVNDPNSELISLQFHPAYAYEDFMLGWRPATGGGWERSLGVFSNVCKSAANQPGKKFVFVIDELNRAEITAVFGEAFTLIDPSKRGDDWSMPLQGSPDPEHLLSVPENVFVIGTINTADRTAHALDYALRRRFAFLYLGPDFGESVVEKMKSRGLDEARIEEIVQKITQVNELILSREFMLGRGFEIAQGYAIPSVVVSNASTWWQSNIENRILPVLKSYFFDDQEAFLSAKAILEG